MSFLHHHRPRRSTAPRHGPRVSSRHALQVVVGLLLSVAQSAFAQQARPSTLAIETIAAVDTSVDFDGNHPSGVIVDAVISAGLGRGLEAIVWPIVQRLASGEWNRQVWIAALRYERPGPVGLRIDGGLIPSPVGLATLARRPHLNPTIAQPSSLFAALPPLEVGAPATNLLAAIYPYGAQVTFSGAHWDARVALIDASPLRSDQHDRNDEHPPRFANLVFGGGVTPIVGLRIGGSVTHGGWQRAGETPASTVDRDATLWTVESEFAFAYTKLWGEWVRDEVDTTLGAQVASGWFVQGQQTLAPRWFVAGRIERISSPVVLANLVQRQRLAGSEEVLGFRLTPEITLRMGHRARRGFGRSNFVHQAAVSVVWWKRWM